MSVEQQIKPCVLLIATRKYVRFVPELVRQLDRWFLPKHEIAITIFSDQQMLPRTTMRVQMVWAKIESYKFPYATLYRYKIFSQYSEYLRKYSHLYYMDVDMGILDEIGDEFLVDGLLAIKHPGTYAAKRWGSPNTDKRSTAYLAPEFQKTYFCGGVQGGEANKYLEACKTLAANIETDEKNKVMAEWHDETHWNKYVNEHPKYVTELSPAYCMPESEEDQKNWGLSEFKPKIIALNKNHEEVRL